MLLLSFLYCFLLCSPSLTVNITTHTDSFAVNKQTKRLSEKRLGFVLQLKKSVAKNAWQEFGKQTNEGCLIYFHQDTSEVFFPNHKIKANINGFTAYHEELLLIKRLDSAPYHMEVMVSYDQSDSTSYYYQNPVEQYSSVEEIGKYIPSVNSTEMWSTMVIHEMFHHFQYNHPHYSYYAKNVIGEIPFSIKDLVSLSRSDEGFFKMIQEENKLLMLAIAEENTELTEQIIKEYLQKRKKRINKYSETHPQLEKVENYYILQEGSARYIEYKSMHALSDYFQQKESPKLYSDSLFQSYTEFESIDLNHENFAYLTYAAYTDYHYAIGFNSLRLLDKLQVPYKAQLLNHVEKGLHKYLEDYFLTTD